MTKTNHTGLFSSTRISSGFTLVELLVAVSITGLMLTFVSILFGETRRAVSQGIALSDIIANSSGISSILESDFDGMIGPHNNSGSKSDVESGGILVIVQHGVPGVEFDVPRSQVPEIRAIRSDQLMFIAARPSSMEPMAPRNASTFAYATIDPAERALIRKVWFGHVDRLRPDGSGVTDDFIAEGLEQVGQEISLGRQNLIVAEAPSAGDVHADGAWADAPFSGGYASSTRLYYGSGDFAQMSLDDLSNSNGTLVAEAESLVQSNRNRSLSADLNDEAYARRAASNYCYTVEQLHYRPLPPDGEVADSLAIAQMHPLLSPNVSDFYVLFAGDYTSVISSVDLGPLDPDGQLDTHDGFDAGVLEGSPGQVGHVDNFGRKYPVIPSGGIKWYTYENFANYPGSVNGYDSLLPLSFGIDPSNVPFGSSDVSGMSHASAYFVWRHDDEGGNVTGDPDNDSYWPYFLRVVWRHHDSRGEILNEQRPNTDQYASGHGLWFEKTLPVNRPPTIATP